MSYFESNIAFLENRGMHYLSLDSQLGDAVAEYVGLDPDGVAWFVDERQKPIGIYPDVDTANLPSKELRQLIFFFGLISVEEIIKVAKTANPDSFFVIIEPNLSLLRHALNSQDLEKLAGINFMLAAVEPEGFGEVMSGLLTTPALLLVKRPVFYFNSYYRQRDIKLLQQYIDPIRKEIKLKAFCMGNCIHDSLIGLIHNMKNMESMAAGLDTAAMKGLFRGCPAFVVSAGPSLDKNIEELKQIGNKGIIIAVDAIAEKLVKNGIVPHFISSVERAYVWELLVEKAAYPDTVYLVGPPTLQPEVVKRFGTKVALPMRETVREFIWLQDMLELSDDYQVWMGASCSHVGVGLAHHLGASPIVFVGQDLAYGEDISHTHAKGVFDDLPPEVPEEVLTVPGYYGGTVKTQQIWQDFRVILEKGIKAYQEGDVFINATEGGSRIEGALQQPLREVVAQYCVREVDVPGLVGQVPVPRIDWSKVTAKVAEYMNKTDAFSDEVKKHLENLEDIRKRWSDCTGTPDGVLKVYATMKKTDKFLPVISNDQLLYHNIQGPVTTLLQKFYVIQNNDDLENLYQNLLVQIELCQMLTQTAWLIARVIEENYPWHFDQSRDAAAEGVSEAGGPRRVQ